MLSDDMLREQGRRNWEEEAQRRYELEQQAEVDRAHRVEVTAALPWSQVGLDECLLAKSNWDKDLGATCYMLQPASCPAQHD